MFIVATVGILTTIALAIARAMLGPTIFDRILAVNMIGTKAILFIAIYGFLTGRPEFLDIALVYTLLNFIGSIAILKFVQFKELSHAATDDEAGDI